MHMVRRCRCEGMIEPAERAPQQCRKLIQEGSGCVILDVRTPQEYSRGHIERAENIDYFSPAFPQKIDSLDKTRTYVVYCKTGIRAEKTCRMMKERGFPFVITIRGGIESWQDEGLPVKK
jgi:rhodanese-related sulfurtransferase